MVDVLGEMMKVNRKIVRGKEEEEEKKEKAVAEKRGGGGDLERRQQQMSSKGKEENKPGEKGRRKRKGGRRGKKIKERKSSCSDEGRRRQTTTTAAISGDEGWRRQQMSSTGKEENKPGEEGIRQWTDQMIFGKSELILQDISSVKMGFSIQSNSVTESHQHTHKVFLLCNYILLGAASSCIFLTLSLRLIPSLIGFFVILLHILTIVGAISGCAAASSGAGKWYGAHMVATVLTAIFQGSISVLIFTRTAEFLGNLKTYVREEDGVIILRLAGGLCVAIFCLEWVVLTLAFFLKYYAYVDGDGGVSTNGMKRSAKVQNQEDLKDWPWPFQV